MKAISPSTYVRWSGAWPGVASASNGPTRAPSADAQVDVAARARDRRAAAEPRAQRRHRLGVVGVVVRQRDAGEAAAPLDLRRDRLDVLRQRRAGVDHPRAARARRSTCSSRSA